VHQLLDIGRAEAERPLAGDGEERRGDFAAAECRVEHDSQPGRDVGPEVSAQQLSGEFDVGDDQREEIVEVVGQPPVRSPIASSFCASAIRSERRF
jgi:hypothetical protein